MVKKKKKSHLPLRLNLLFFVIFLLFSVLILQLGVVQILYGQDAQDEINRTEQVTSQTPVPRGRMFDRMGNLIVDNEAQLAITYTPRKHVQPEDNLKLAKELVEFLEMDTDSVSERNMKDFWILENHEKAFSRLTPEDLEGDDLDQYYAALDYVTEDDLDEITNEDMKVIAIKRELDQAYELTPHIIKRDQVTQEEYAIIAENLNQFPGINVTTDWERDFLYDGTFRNYIGSITTSRQGLPSDDLEYFITRNYNRNDRVGRSGIEEEYELSLKGHKEVREHITDSSGNVVTSELVREGERGKDLVLSIDIELQERLDQIVQEELETAIEMYPEENRFMNNAMAVMMDPNTGEVLAISGQDYDRDAEEDETPFSDESFRVIYDSHLPGSSIKGATLLAGLDSGVVSPDEVINDRPIKIAGDEEKSSIRDMGNVNDIDALRRSSNIYMFFIAMRMGGEFNYSYGDSISYDQQGYVDMVNYFKQFGLGVSTGIDFPYEGTGVSGDGDQAYELIDFAIGQYESYTTLQLAQYVSTIANGGYRIAPSLVKQIHSSGETEKLGPIYSVNEPKVLNKLGVSDDHLDRVHEGFRQAFQEEGGTAYYQFNDVDYSPAGKTGTAEDYVFIDGQRHYVQNLTLVGYAPHDQPEVAFAVVVPHTGVISGGESQHPINLTIGRRALDSYFELQEEREEDLEDELEDNEVIDDENDLEDIDEVDNLEQE
ncbi:peptidoglycan D,D-transpeptidase FtsI family protein [Alkalibacillus aidingensis]|uniref:peptidoglycan D,D-transpeptidase FtsI family protein n=1 Tax=Alkalibacillus aidingensis TaxID=2747607 RepID=UPI002948BB6A|nr:penicillin-binding protein 2 [Alkalibacillus aidingensis]